ncbi:hypothetical protein DFQ26_006568 [Actinomortierella ambigua]|nr:hypothetical protein DFQ26_006568 [Actinomortierella ambigua]
MEIANDVLLAQLLNLGLDLKQARAAVAAGNTSVEQATAWIFDNSNSVAQQPTTASTTTTASSGALRLRPDDFDDVDLQRAIALSTVPQEPHRSSESTKKPPIKINIIRAGQVSQPQATDSSSSSSATVPAPAAPAPARAAGATGSPSPPSTSAKRERESDKSTTNTGTGVTPMLPLMSSRQREAEFEAENARLKKEAEQLAEKSKRLKQLEREARQRALQAIREDREKSKTKQHVAPPLVEPSLSSSSTSSSSTSASSPTARKTTMVQLRLKNGMVLKRSFDNSATLRQLFDAVVQEDPSLSGEDIRLIQPFPRREFGVSEAQQTLQEAGLCPSCSLNVHVPPSTNPAPPSEPVLSSPLGSIPGSWHPAPPTFSQIGNGDEPEPMDIDELEDEENDNNNNDDYEDNNQTDDTDEDDEDDEDMDNPDNDDGLVHMLPIGHGHGQPFGGRGRGRGGVLRGGHGRGRGGLPFSGAGHRLSSRSGGPSGSGGGGTGSGGGGGGGGDNNADDTNMDETPAQPMSPAERRQRVLDAMAARAAAQQSAAGTATSPASGESSSPTDASSCPKGNAHKTGPPRVIPSLLSRSSYEVAVLLTSNDSKRVKYLKNLAEVGSQAAELIVQNLIRLKQLDQLSVKRLGRCAIVNLSLDGYSRTTDSLMETFRWTQGPSLSYLSLRGCALLTEAGFSQIPAFHELEHLDLSHCRITDASLVHLLELSELRVLILSSTKVTSRGIANTVSKASWKEHLHTLDLSACEGVQGPSVLIDLQELLCLRNLRLNNTRAFDRGPILVPDSLGFRQLEELDLMHTPIHDEDLQAVRSSFPALEVLNLAGCVHLTDVSLQRLCSMTGQAEEEETMPELTTLKFPDRESPLSQVLPLVAERFGQLSQLDLTGFLNVADATLLSLGAATNLTMLSLAGTKLTDVGAPVLAHLELLRELNLDRTVIQDKSIDHLRGLGRLEILSLSRCPKLTVDAIKLLSMSACFERTLKRLNLSFNSLIHDEGLVYLEQAHALISLNLDHTDVTTVRAHRLADKMETLTQLRVVGVSEGERAQERGVYSIASAILAQNHNNNNNNIQNFDL